MIKNLIFDFGKVLVDYEFRHVIDKFFDNWEDESLFLQVFAGKEFCDRCDREAEPYEEITNDMKRQYPQFVRQIDLFNEMYADFITNEVPGMRELLTDLKANGYKLYGLTNWDHMVYEVLNRFEIFKLLDGRIISSEEKVIKPEPEIYHRLFEKYNLKPEECLFADDKIANVEGALKEGMDSIVFQNTAQYMEELRKRNINYSHS